MGAEETGRKEATTHFFWKFEKAISQWLSKTQHSPHRKKKKNRFEGKSNIVASRRIFVFQNSSTLWNSGKKAKERTKHNKISGAKNNWLLHPVQQARIFKNVFLTDESTIQVHRSLIKVWSSKRLPNPVKKVPTFLHKIIVWLGL